RLNGDIRMRQISLMVQRFSLGFQACVGAGSVSVHFPRRLLKKPGHSRNSKTNTMHIALLGAGGKMGCRLTANLRHLSHYQISSVETDEERSEELAANGIKTIPLEEAIRQAAIVVLAIPDRLIGKVTRDIVPSLS